MEATLRNKSQSTTKTRTKSTIAYQEPKRLSKAGIWKRENPKGIGIIIDHRAVNR